MFCICCCVERRNPFETGVVTVSDDRLLMPFPSVNFVFLNKEPLFLCHSLDGTLKT